MYVTIVYHEVFSRVERKPLLVDPDYKRAEIGPRLLIIV